MSVEGALGLYRQVVNDQIGRRDARNAGLARSGMGIASTLGDVWGQKQEADRQTEARAALKNHLVTDFGADPAEVDRVLDTKNRDVINAFGQRAAEAKRLRGAAGMLGFDPTAGMAPGMADTLMGAGGAAAPPAAPTPRAQGSFGGEGTFGPTVTPGAAPPPPPPQPQGSFGDGQTFGQAGGAPAAPALPSGAMQMPSRSELLRRFLSSGARDAGSLQTALGFLPPEPKTMTAEDAAQAEEARARAELYRAQAGQVGQPRPAAEKRDEDPLTPDLAGFYGVDPKYVGKITVGDAKAMALRAGAGKGGEGVDAAAIMDMLRKIERGEPIAPGTMLPGNMGPSVATLFGQRMRAKRPPVSDATADALGIPKGTPLDEVKFVVDKMLNDAKSRALQPGELAGLNDIRKQNQDFITERSAQAGLLGENGQPQFPDTKRLVDAAVEQNKKIDAVLMKKIAPGATGLGDVPAPPGAPAGTQKQAMTEDAFRQSLPDDMRAEYDGMTDAEKAAVRQQMEAK
jgi:hypothetical protein